MFCIEHVLLAVSCGVTDSDDWPIIPPHPLMSQRKSATKINDEVDRKADALHQYQDTDGHFSLVR
jgi:hypothetical protein